MKTTCCIAPGSSPKCEAKGSLILVLGCRVTEATANGQAALEKVLQLQGSVPAPIARTTEATEEDSAPSELDRVLQQEVRSSGVVGG